MDNAVVYTHFIAVENDLEDIKQLLETLVNAQQPGTLMPVDEQEQSTEELDELVTALQVTADNLKSVMRAGSYSNESITKALSSAHRALANHRERKRNADDNIPTS